MYARWLIAGTSLALMLGCRNGSESPAEPTSAAAGVTGALSFRQLAAGAGHTCGVTPDNAVYCWGNNSTGQLGLGWATIGGGVDRPAAVVGGLRFRQISAGAEHTCGITTDSLAYCWGRNRYGRLGDGTTTDRSRPTAVAGGRKFRQIDAGSMHTCGLTPANRVYCWGNNGSGQVGDGTVIVAGRLRPVAVAGAHLFRHIAAGGDEFAGHTCGLTTDDRVWCWGDNSRGQVGDGTTVRRLVPTLIAGGRRYLNVDAGGSHSCAVTMANRAICWGNGNAFGRAIVTPWPTLVSAAIDFARMTLGDRHTCGESISHRPYCWGIGDFGQLGNGEFNSILDRPTLVLGGLRFRQMSAGGVHTCGRTAENVAYCWGNNFMAQLGDGTRDHRTTPTPVLGPS
jgi:alpha-tubulin suppressor-like RCC1 family protein